MAETVTLTDARTRLGNLVAKEYFRRKEDEADIAHAEKIMATDPPTAIPHGEVVKMFGGDAESDA